MARQACASCRRVRLDGVALIEQAFLIELLQQPPQGLDILIVIGDVRMVQIDKIAHLLRQFTPLGGVHHHILAALAVVVLRRYVALRLLVVDVSLGDAQFLLHTQFYGQSVGVPAGLTLHLIAAHGLIAVERVLDAACQHVVNAGVSVGRRRTLEEHKLRTTLALVHRAPEDILLLPHLQDVIVHLRQVQAVMLGKSLTHIANYFLIFLRVCMF